MKDRVINVPLEDADIEKTVSTLPRHPEQAHLVAVQLKRKIELKTSQLEGFIRPNIVVKALKTLKSRGNIFYKDININENFMESENMDLDNQVIDETESQILEREMDEMEEVED